MTECTQSQFEFEAHFSRRVVAEFSGERLTTEGGSLLLRAADRKIGLLRRVGRCFTDAGDPQRIEHELSAMLAQRIYGLALGYEDLNDHEELRNDPLLGMLAGRRDLDAQLAGKSTLNRLERTPAGSPSSEGYNKISYSSEAIDILLVDLFLEAHPQAPQELVLALDATDTPLHGRQESRFFHGYYGHYCYLPLCVFCGDHLLCARLRPAAPCSSRRTRDPLTYSTASIHNWCEIRASMRRDLQRRRHVGMHPHRNARISPIRNPVVVAGRMIVRVGSLLAATSRRTSSARRNLRGRFKALSYISTPRKGLFKT